jgi:hypothetical protein
MELAEFSMEQTPGGNSACVASGLLEYSNTRWRRREIGDEEKPAVVPVEPAKFPEGYDFPRGGGTSGGMEPRIAKLEALAEHIQKDIAEIKTDVREFRSGIGGSASQLEH